MNSDSRRLISRAFGIGFAGTIASLFAASCSSTTPSPAGTCANKGAAAPGPADTHCVMNGVTTYQTVDPTRCTMMDPGASPDDGGGGDAAGDDAATAGDDSGTDGTSPAPPEGGQDSNDAGDIGNCGDSSFGATMYGQHGLDDDCKYDVTWSSTPICENQPVYFTVTVMTHSIGQAVPVTGANPLPDVVLNCSHPIPNTPAPKDPSPETSPGTYTVGPIVFDKPGRWVFRFHFFEMERVDGALVTCLDQPDSPHGHAAFYIQVP
jgi:hypothetical protein